MIHTHIQEKLLLYLDGSLPDGETQQIREHLSICSICAEQHDALALIWRSESRLEKKELSPFIWTRLHARIKEYEQAPVDLWYLKKIFAGITMHPILALAIISAVVMGVYLGTPRESQMLTDVRVTIRSAAIAEELGLDQFDVIPPGTFGSRLAKISNTMK